MSCIVASRQGWIVADTRLSGGGEICVCDVKKVVTVGDHSLFTAVGDFVLLQLVQEVLDDTAHADTKTLVLALCKFFQQYDKQVNGEMAVVGKQNNLYVVTCDGGHYEPLDYYHCNGSGRHAAYGYLKGLDKATGGKLLTMQDAGDAIKLAASVDVGVNTRLYGLSLFGHTFDPLA